MSSMKRHSGEIYEVARSRRERRHMWFRKILVVVIGALNDKLWMCKMRKRLADEFYLIKQTGKHTRRWWKMNWSELNREVVVNFYLAAYEIAPIYAMSLRRGAGEKRADGFSDDATGEFTVYILPLISVARGNRFEEWRTNLEWIKLNNYQLM